MPAHEQDVQELRRRLEEAEETLRAIRSGEVDALVVEGAAGERVYTLQGADYPYRALIEAMQQGAVSLSGDGTVLYCNRCFADMLQTSHEQVIGAAMDAFVPASQQASFETLLRQGRTGNSQGELQLQTADGTLVPAYISLAPLPLPDGVALCMVVTDLTEQKKQHDRMRVLTELREGAEVARRRSEGMVRGLFQHIPMSILVSDLEGRIRQANLQCEQLFGYGHGDLIGQPVEALIPERFREAHRLHRHQYATRPRTRRMGEGQELYGRRKDGSEFPVDIMLAPLEVADETLVLSSIADITHHKANEEIIRIRAQQQNALAEFGQRALGSTDLSDLLNQVIDLLARTLEIDLCRYLEFSPGGDNLLLRAGRGWKPEYIGRMTFGTGTGSQAGYCLLTGQPVIVKDLSSETRFTPSPVLLEHGAVSGISVAIQGRERSHGVLDVHATRPRQFSGEDVLFVQGVANMLASIIERTQAEDALQLVNAKLRDQSRLLQSVLNSISEGVIAAHQKGQLLVFNPAAEHILGMERTEMPPASWSEIYGLFCSDGTSPFPVADLPLVRALRGEPSDDVEILARRPERSSNMYLTATGRPLLDEAGAVMGGVVVFRDITARRRGESELQESEERFRNAFDYAPSGMWLVGLDGRWLRVNRALCHMVGRTEEELLATTFQAITHPDDLEADLEQVRKLSAGEICYYDLEKRYYHKDGHPVWVRLSASLVRDRHGKPLYFVGHVQDISQSKQANAALQAALEEKETLLKEVHHRVKNNLAITVSLLNFQIRKAGDPLLVETLREAQNRIQAMAMVHELLYHSKSLAGIALRTYVEQLTRQLLSGYSVSGRVHFQVSVPKMELSLEAAIPFGLILNELVSNVCKHAFPKGQDGRLRIGVTPAEGGRLRLVVADDGCGLPAEIDPFATRSLGLKLVRDLTHQLGGSVEVVSAAGTAFHICFPIDTGATP